MCAIVKKKTLQNIIITVKHLKMNNISALYNP